MDGWNLKMSHKTKLSTTKSCETVSTVSACRGCRSTCLSSAAGCWEQWRRCGRWARGKPAPSGWWATPGASVLCEELPAPWGATPCWDCRLPSLSGQSWPAFWSWKTRWPRFPAEQELTEVTVRKGWADVKNTILWWLEDGCRETYCALQTVLHDADELLVGLDAQVAQHTQHVTHVGVQRDDFIRRLQDDQERSLARRKPKGSEVVVSSLYLLWVLR